MVSKKEAEKMLKKGNFSLMKRKYKNDTKQNYELYTLLQDSIDSKIAYKMLIDLNFSYNIFINLVKKLNNNDMLSYIIHVIDNDSTDLLTDLNNIVDFDNYCDEVVKNYIDNDKIFSILKYFDVKDKNLRNKIIDILKNDIYVIKDEIISYFIANSKMQLTDKEVIDLYSFYLNIKTIEYEKSELSEYSLEELQKISVSNLKYALLNYLHDRYGDEKIKALKNIIFESSDDKSKIMYSYLSNDIDIDMDYFSAIVGSYDAPIDYITKNINNLTTSHIKKILVYGTDNVLRLVKPLINMQENYILCDVINYHLKIFEKYLPHELLGNEYDDLLEDEAPNPIFGIKRILFILDILSEKGNYDKVSEYLTIIIRKLHGYAYFNNIYKKMGITPLYLMSRYEYKNKDVINDVISIINEDKKTKASSIDYALMSQIKYIDDENLLTLTKKALVSENPYKVEYLKNISKISNIVLLKDIILKTNDKELITAYVYLANDISLLYKHFSSYENFARWVNLFVIKTGNETMHDWALNNISQEKIYKDMNLTDEMIDTLLRK